MTLALLIDGETIPPFVVEEMLLETDAYGEVGVKRVYANWTPKAVHVWHHTINMYGFDPIQQYPCAYPRTSSDGMMIIDAMDLLHRGSLSGFCIASNSDAYARLTTRLRESGVVVYGFGDDTVAESFVRSCNSFVKLEVLGTPNPLRPRGFHKCSDSSWTPQQTTEIDICTIEGRIPNPAIDRTALKAVLNAVRNTTDASGFAKLAHIRQELDRLSPPFECRQHGYTRLSDLLIATGMVESEEVIGQRKAIAFKIKPEFEG